MSQSIQYHLIETQEDLEHFYQANKNVSQLAFDTEFVGEKRYYTLLCLVQVATEHGFYLIESQGFTPFFAAVGRPEYFEDYACRRK
jgi:ribonuclease D